MQVPVEIHTHAHTTDGYFVNFSRMASARMCSNICNNNCKNKLYNACSTGASFSFKATNTHIHTPTAHTKFPQTYEQKIIRFMYALEGARVFLPHTSYETHAITHVPHEHEHTLTFAPKNCTLCAMSTPRKKKRIWTKCNTCPKLAAIMSVLEHMRRKWYIAHVHTV